MRKFVAGIILGAGLMLGISVSANEVVSFVGKSIQNEFPVKVDGKEIETPGIVVDGLSYLPTRTIAEIAKFEVSFDEKTGIELTSKEPVSSQVPFLHPLSVKIQEISQEISVVGTAKLRLQAEITQIKGNNKDADTSDMERQLAEYEAQLTALEAEKDKLEIELFGAPQ